MFFRRKNQEEEQEDQFCSNPDYMWELTVYEYSRTFTLRAKRKFKMKERKESSYDRYYVFSSDDIEHASNAGNVRTWNQVCVKP